jgi:DNA-binding protein H-NS
MRRLQNDKQKFTAGGWMIEILSSGVGGSRRRYLVAIANRAEAIVELVKPQQRVEEAIAAKRVADAQATKEQLRQMAEKAGFDIRELYGKRGPKGTGVAKYRNPKDHSQTWTGRGRKPNWLIDAVKKGAKIENFAI